MIAKIPNRILYVCRPEVEVNIGWEDFEDGSYKKLVTPAYPVDPSGDKKVVQRAIDWARYRQGEDFNPQTKEAENSHIPHVEIVNLEIRGEGGRAYKVSVDGCYVDLREDVFLDALLINGIEPGGRLKGPFIWARVGSQMKLVRVGSALHDRVVEAHGQNAKKDIGKSAIEPGDVCRNRKGDVFVYLGQCNTTLVERRGNTLDYTHVTKQQGWFQIPDWCAEKYANDYGKALAHMLEEAWPYYFEIVTKKTVVEKLGSVILPDKPFARLRCVGRKHVSKEVQKERGFWRNDATLATHTALGVTRALYARATDEVWPENLIPLNEIVNGDP